MDRDKALRDAKRDADLSSAKRLGFFPSRAVMRAMALLTASIIAVLSLTSTGDLELLTPKDDTLSEIVSTLGHFLLYSLLTLFAVLGWPQLGWRVAVAVIAYGGLLELAQLGIADRSVSGIDFAANLLGVAGGWVSSKAIGQRRHWMRPRGDMESSP